jgi:hypothetical protein
VKLPDNDADGTISILTGKVRLSFFLFLFCTLTTGTIQIALMDPECIDFTIPNDTSGIYANLPNFDAYIEAERVSTTFLHFDPNVLRPTPSW